MVRQWIVTPSFAGSSPVVRPNRKVKLSILFIPTVAFVRLTTYIIFEFKIVASQYKLVFILRTMTI